MNFKKQLRLYLAERDMTATELARAAKVPKQSISNWLAGSSPRDITQAKRVADVFEVTLDQLLFGEGTASKAVTNNSIDELLGDNWVSGMFEVRLRRVKARNSDHE